MSHADSTAAGVRRTPTRSAPPAETPGKNAMFCWASGSSGRPLVAFVGHRSDTSPRPSARADPEKRGCRSGSGGRWVREADHHDREKADGQHAEPASRGGWAGRRACPASATTGQAPLPHPPPQRGVGGTPSAVRRSAAPPRAPASTSRSPTAACRPPSRGSRRRAAPTARGPARRSTATSIARTQSGAVPRAQRGRSVPRRQNGHWSTHVTPLLSPEGAIFDRDPPPAGARRIRPAPAARSPAPRR